MPRNSVVGKRYATTLFSLAEHSLDSLRVARQELEMFLVGLNQTHKGWNFFLSPVVPQSEKEGVLQELKNLFSTTHLFLLLLVRQGRLGYVKDIVEELDRMLQKLSGEVEVRLDSAYALRPGVAQDVGAILEEKWKQRIKLKTNLCPELIGGFVARGPNRILDASLVGQLEALKQYMLSS